jgi:NitT/TauT family transport system substrate-binding protein
MLLRSREARLGNGHEEQEGQLIRKVLLAAAAWLGASASAFAADKVTLALDWLADPQFGGYYQAVVDGTYAKYGLEVTLMPGGPQVNGGMLLIAGKIEFAIGGDMIGDLLAAHNDLPTVAVAADFQKNPQVFMSHPGVGLDKFEDLPKAEAAFVSAGALNTFYAWMRLAYGFKDEITKPYNYNSAPFIADKHSIQQGYLTSEPHDVEKQGGFKPNVFLLSDYGYSTYATLIETRRDIVANNPDLVQRFVDASAIGWYHYLYGDNTAANEMIRKENPDLNQEEIDFAIAKIKEYGVIDSGDTLKGGIGAMTDAHWKDFFDKMVNIGVVPADTDFKKIYTLKFVNKGVGLSERPQ